MASLMHLPLLSFKFFLLWQQLTPQLVAFICKCVKLQSNDVRTATTSVQNALIKFNSALHYPLLTALTKSFYNILNKNRSTFNWSEIHLMQKSDFTFLELK